ncbi:MAG TPA: hypothetical protein VFS40_09700 [Gemmatimonadales bacterium]|nr:hypothetical protein [Gemmatimonadales bacterium]
MTLSPLAAAATDTSSIPTPVRPLWPALTLGSMVLLIVVLVARLITLAPTTSATIDRGTNYLDSTAFAAVPVLAEPAHPPLAGR